MNIKLSYELILQLLRIGVQDFICCAGARNAPLIKLIHLAKGINVYSFFEERSAGFFALGKIKANNRPVCVITTSGTAVANLLPSVMEAHHAELPLIVVSADRPKSYRGSGAPQSTLQAGLFSHFAQSYDIESIEEIKSLQLTGTGPKQINICFDEPLIDAELPVIKAVDINFSPLVKQKNKASVTTIKHFLCQAKRPLIIASQLSMEDAKKVAAILENLQRPIYTESHSQLSPLLSTPLFGGELTVKQLVENNEIDSVIRIGAIPTLRLWRDLENYKWPVLNFSHKTFTGLSYVKTEVMPLHSLELLSGAAFESCPSLPEIDQQKSQDIFSALKKYNQCEVSFIKKLIETLPVEDQIFIGNSLAIRELDLIFPLVGKPVQVFSQRGLNGIDGLVSTGLGLADDKKTTWIILGDLTTLYDLSGLWPAIRNPELKFKIVIINNSGGKIFQKVFSDPNFENRHGLGFESWAKMWDMTYKKIDCVNQIAEITNEKIIELMPSSRESKLFWNEL